jgi:two-component system sensor histidine kinase CpxA
VAIELARSSGHQDSVLDRIQKESERLNTLVGELLQVTRAEVDPAARHSEPVALGTLLAGIVEDAQVEARAHGCEVKLSTMEAARVSGDPELLRRAIENVVRNAIRFAPQGTSVEVTLTSGKDQAGISVRDFGPGVPEEALPHIFTAFYRVDSDRTRASGGVGLGLAIARRAIELHHGTLHARNANPGLLVEMSIPCAAGIAASPLSA